jgi:coenzyme F420-dependent glucose-6-phosphate dehydrogenase
MYSDGLVTYLGPQEARKTLEAFGNAAKKAGRDAASLEKMVEYKVSFSEDYDRALQSAMFWRATLLKGIFNSSITDPRKLQQKAEKEVPIEKIKESIRIITSIEDCINPIEDYFKAGFTRVYVHSTSPDEIGFLQALRDKVMPHFNTHIMQRDRGSTTAAISA